MLPLIVETRGQVAHLILNRPDKRNALGRTARLARRRSGRIADDANVRVVVVFRRGPVFCSGHDLGEMVGCSRGATIASYSRCARA